VEIHPDHTSQSVHDEVTHFDLVADTFIQSDSQVRVRTIKADNHNWRRTENDEHNFNPTGTSQILQINLRLRMYMCCLQQHLAVVSSSCYAIIAKYNMMKYNMIFFDFSWS